MPSSAQEINPKMKRTPGFPGQVLNHSPLGRSKKVEGPQVCTAGHMDSLNQADLRAPGLCLETRRDKCGQWGNVSSGAPDAEI